MQDKIFIIQSPVTINYLKELAADQFTEMIKAVVDIEKGIMSVGGSLHADEEKQLLQKGSLQKDLWGINIYFDVDDEDRVEFDSMINIKPSQNNRTRFVEDKGTRDKIILIVNKLIHL